MKNKLGGFTLYEVMTVVAIIGIFASMATPSIAESIEKQRFISDIQKLTSFHTQARNVARTIRKCVLVSPASTATWKAVNMGEDCATPSGEVLRELSFLDKGSLRISTLQDHYFLFDGSFSADGVASARTPHVFEVKSKDGLHTRQIRIYGAIGRVAVVKGTN